MNKSFYIQSSFKKSMSYSQCLALESRMVFDGAGVVTAVDVQQTISDQPSANPVSVASIQPSEPVASFLPESIPQTIDYFPNVDVANNQAQFFVAPDVSNSIDTSVVMGTNTGQATTIFIVDPRTEEAALLSLNPPVNAQVIILDPARDGFLQVTEQLQNRHDVTELHIIPWTKDNQQWLGSQSVSATLEPIVSNNLIAWDNALVDNAKLVFHGQNSMDASWLAHVGAITSTQTSWLLDSKTDSLSSGQAKTVIFIDSAVQDVADIISSIDASTEIVYLDATKDGLTQIADYLDARTGIDSVQIISHANKGTLQLGNEILTNTNLADHTAQLATIGHSLTLNGDILLYGCDLAKSTEGSQFVDSFSYLTQADVAASADITGAASKGGNWTLEYTTGTIEASVLAASHYQDILALPTFNVAGGSLVFGVPVLKSGSGLNAGSIILFDNVISFGTQKIDAVVTIVDVASGATVSALDSLPTPPGLGLGNPINPNWFELDTVSATVGGVPTKAAVTIKFDFILNGTYNPAIGDGTDVLLQNVIVNSYDIDNTQFQEFGGFSSYSLSTPTDLTVKTGNGFTGFADSTGTNNTGINLPTNLTLLNQARVTATYNEINTFQIKVGSGNPQTAFFYLDFGQTYGAITPSVTVHAPIAVNDTGIGSTGNSVSIDVTTNGVTNTGRDSDPDLTSPLDPATVKIVAPTAADGSKVVPGQGTWTVVLDPATGRDFIKFTPFIGFTGNPTPISYTVKDTGGLESNAATVTITYPPIVRPDTATGITGSPVTLSVLGNDGDTGVILNPASVKIVGTAVAGAPLDVPNEGTWTVNTDTGEITFTPLSTFTGNPTPIQYTVKDTGGLESVVPTTVTVIMDSLPLANPDRNTASVGGSAVTGDLINNDQPGTIPTSVTSASQGTNPIIIGSAFTTVAGGVLLLKADGSYSYIPPSNVTSSSLTEIFNYTITDSKGNTSSSILTIVVAPTTSGSLIQLSNPTTFFSNDRSIFFVAKPLETVTVKPSNFGLYIPSANDIISLTGSLRDQVVLELQHFSFDIPSGSFRHTNPNAQLEFEATRPDGSALPNWLQFNPKLLRFSGVPPKGAYNQEVMVTARDSYGNEVHAIFYVHVNKERARPDHKSLSVDLKLMGLSNKVLEKNTHKEKTVAKPALSERMNKIGKMGKLQESRALLDSLKDR
jgi:CshA-type fibril repeat protein